jgi:hypothetical protein
MSCTLDIHPLCKESTDELSSMVVYEKNDDGQRLVAVVIDLDQVEVDISWYIEPSKEIIDGVCAVIVGLWWKMQTTGIFD